MNSLSVDYTLKLLGHRYVLQFIYFYILHVNDLENSDTIIANGIHITSLSEYTSRNGEEKSQVLK